MAIRRTTIRTRPNTSINWKLENADSNPDNFDVNSYEITSSEEILSSDGLTLTTIKEFPTLDDLVRYDYDGISTWINGQKIYMDNHSMTFAITTLDLNTNTQITPQQIDARAAELGFPKI